MARVVYRYTFLDVLLEDEERARDTRAGRARSEPPLLGRAPCRSTEEDAELHRYVRSLPGLGEGQEPQAQQPKATGPGAPALSAGSVGHPTLCQRPCVHIAAGRWCDAGTSCDFCHWRHSHITKLDKQQRRMIEEMPKHDFLRLTVQLLKDKARDAGIRGAEAIFNVLEAELKSEEPNPTGCSSGGGAPPRRLVRCLRPASFAAIASLAARKCTEGGKIQVRESMEALRRASC
ncbi:Pka-R2 [Symbiodinium pilosum]|uniref:Pka-R2 protein n=1 Tax=Symbiodinium pilosum TaxID=2952 RepID=A0A812JFX1_SYMPI|nr:Pka-R2 [Symbiodinium pilosum]